MTSVATPASADVVTQAGQCGTVAVVGLATPNPMKPFVESGCVQSVVLWNPIDLGYAAVYVMRAVVDGTLQPGDTSVEAGRLGTLQIVNGSEVLLGGKNKSACEYQSTKQQQCQPRERSDVASAANFRV